MPVKKTTTKETAEKTPATKAAPKTRATAKKTTTRATTAAKTTTSQVAANARHIQENASEIKNNSKMIHVLYGAIILLLMVIAGLAFYVGQILGNNNSTPVNTAGTTINTAAEDITITIIDDARCSDCQTDAIAGQLKAHPLFVGSTFIEQDFSDAGVAEYIQENNITLLPAVIFNTNAFNDGGQIVPYLTALPNNSFSLALGAKFDPFQSRSDKGFLILETSEIEALKADSPIDGNADAQITWIEYSDLECPYCAQLHNNDTDDTLKETFGDDLNILFQHFPLDFHPNALTAAQGLECANEQWADYYGLIDASFQKYNSNNFSVDGFYDLAVEAGADKDTLIECVNSGKYEEKSLAQQASGQSLFGITGTPGNVLINNETGEYEVISGAYPAATFQAIIDRMLAE